MMTDYVNFFCGFFFNFISNLQIPSISKIISNLIDITDPVLAASNIFQDHPSIKDIRAKHFKLVFPFIHTSKVEIKKIIRGMSLHKSCQIKYIPTRVIKMNADNFINFICLHFNYCIDIGECPQVFKHADIITVRRKKKVIKLITDLSAYYQKLIYNQLYDYLDKILLPRQCGFHKWYISLIIACYQCFVINAYKGSWILSIIINDSITTNYYLVAFSYCFRLFGATIERLPRK